MYRVEMYARVRRACRVEGMSTREASRVFGSERLTGALLDRLTHHVHILEMNGESYRLNQSRQRRDPAAE